MHAPHGLRIRTSDPAFDAAFDAAAQRVLTAVVAVPPFGSAAGEPAAPPRVPTATRIAAAALLLGSRSSAAATLQTCAAAMRAHAGTLPANFATRQATDDDDTCAALFAMLAERYLAATGDVGLLIELWPLLRAAPAPAAVAAIGEAIGAPPQRAPDARLVRIDLPRLRSSAHVRTPANGAERHRAAGAEHTGAATDAAELVLHAVEDTIGFRPDAARQRIVLQPSLTGTWAALHAEELIVGDAAVSFDWEITDTRATLVLDQTSGAVPLRCVLQAMLPLHSVGRVTINGSRADIAIERRGAFAVLPVQLSLDGEKVIEVVTA